MGYLIPKRVIAGEAEDIETVVRLRPWIEDEWRAQHGEFRSTILRTDYDKENEIFKFQIIFNI